MIEDLKKRCKAVAENLPTIETFTFDDLSVAISAPDIKYRLLHITNPLVSSIPNNNQPFQVYPMEMFIFNLDKEQNTEKELTSDQRVALWQLQELKGHEFIKELLKPFGSPTPQRDIILTDDPIGILRGHLQHTDVLIGVRFSFSLKMFECRNP